MAYLTISFVLSWWIRTEQYGWVHAEASRGLTARKITTLSRKDGLGSDSIGPLLESKATASSGAPAGLLIGTSAGLSRFSAGGIQNFFPQNDSSQNAITAMAHSDDGSIWVYSPALKLQDYVSVAAIAVPWHTKPVCQPEHPNVRCSAPVQACLTSFVAMVKNGSRLQG